MHGQGAWESERICRYWMRPNISWNEVGFLQHRLFLSRLKPTYTNKEYVLFTADGLVQTGSRAFPAETSLTQENTKNCSTFTCEMPKMWASCHSTELRHYTVQHRWFWHWDGTKSLAGEECSLLFNCQELNPSYKHVGHHGEQMNINKASWRRSRICLSSR